MIFMHIHATEIFYDREDEYPMKIGKVIDGKFIPKRSLVDYIAQIWCSRDRYGYVRGDEDIEAPDGPVIVDRLWIEKDN